MRLLPGLQSISTMRSICMAARDPLTRIQSPAIQSLGREQLRRLPLRGSRSDVPAQLFDAVCSDERPRGHLRRRARRSLPAAKTKSSAIPNSVGRATRLVEVGALRLFAQLAHGAHHRDRCGPSAPSRAQALERRAHRLGIGVVGVVDRRSMPPLGSGTCASFGPEMGLVARETAAAIAGEVETARDARPAASRRQTR